MPTTDDLREALAAREVHAGDPRIVLAHVDARSSGPHRRPQFTTLVAAGAGVAAVVTVTVAVTALASGGSSGRNSAADQGTSAATLSDSSPAAQRVSVTPQVAAQTLISLLPRPGTTSQLSGQSDLGEVGATLVYDDGHGAAQLSVLLSYPYRSTNPSLNGQLQEQAAGLLCSSQAVTQLNDPCTTLADGTQFTVYQGDANVPGGPKDWELRLLRTDGVEVDITELNATLEKEGRQTRPEPPLTVAELTTIAQSSSWQGTVSAQAARDAAGLFTPDATP
jgi:hypothetical protein